MDDIIRADDGELEREELRERDERTARKFLAEVRAGRFLPHRHRRRRPARDPRFHGSGQHLRFVAKADLVRAEGRFEKLEAQDTERARQFVVAKMQAQCRHREAVEVGNRFLFLSVSKSRATSKAMSVASSRSSRRKSSELVRAARTRVSFTRMSG